MALWEYATIRQDTLDGFQVFLNHLGLEGWEAVSANYVMHTAEELGSGNVAPARPVWIAVMKRPLLGAEE
jgi:hypothetical protein